VAGLAAIAAAGVGAAVVELGPPASSARTSREVITASRGIVQSTVSGTGNVEPGTDVDANFQTSGTLQHVYVKVGDHVIKGQLIGTLDPTAAQRTLDQAQESLTSAEDSLTNAEEATVTTSTAATAATATTEFAAYRPTTTTATTTTQSATTTGTTTTSASTTPTRSGGSSGSSGSSGSGSSGSGGSSSGSSGSSGASTGSGSSGASTGSSSSGGETAATKAANIASAQASVDGAEADVANATTALHETHLYAPATGTVVSVADLQPGDEISGGSSSSSSSSSSTGSGSSGSTGSTGATGSTSSGSLGGSTSSTSSSTSSSAFAEIVSTGKMTMTVAFSESDISKVKVGQPATVTLEALSGVELAAKVTSISTLGTTSSSVVSYDATLTLTQRDGRVKPGMSATASVVTGQASGVTLPNTAVSSRGTTSTVNELRNGTTVSTPIVVGMQGDSRTQIVSGLKAGAQVEVVQTLPSLGSSSASSSSSSGTLGGSSSRFGGAGGAAGGGFGGAGGFGGGGFARRAAGG
jgi:multidrug efflux pump subunit AcrA (membrane-fusion protein)